MLGPNVDIDIDAIDETNTRINVPALLARFRRHDDYGLVALVGVQSNQYPRALDIGQVTGFGFPDRQLSVKSRGSIKDRKSGNSCVRIQVAAH